MEASAHAIDYLYWEHWNFRSYTIFGKAIYLKRYQLKMDKLLPVTNLHCSACSVPDPIVDTAVIPRVSERSCQ